MLEAPIPCLENLGSLVLGSPEELLMDLETKCSGIQLIALKKVCFVCVLRGLVLSVDVR